MFHHWKLQKRRDPCGEMGGFTRLLTSHSGNRDGRSFDDEIPTFYVKELSGGAARGYVVANRPYSMTQFVQHADFRKVVTEEYVYIAETDHVMLRPLPNLATAQMPAGFNFGYMVAWGQAKIVDKFVPGLGGKTDPVGPSPIIIHVEQLVKIVQPWCAPSPEFPYRRTPEPPCLLLAPARPRETHALAGPRRPSHALARPHTPSHALHSHLM